MRSSAPKKLVDIQRLAASVIMRSLDGEDRMQSQWVDGRDMNDVATTFIKPNDRLSSFERLEIYNRQYWYRLIDNFYEDFPGLLAIVGNERFSVLARAYLKKYPSRSFTLRNLCGNLIRFLQDEPRWVHPDEQISLDMVRFEWARVIAFDGPALPPISADDLAGANPAKLKLGLQPYITLLDMAYPLDRFSLALKRQGYRAEASNAMEESDQPVKARRVARPRKGRTLVAVHRHENDLYYKRLEPAAFGLLKSLAAGKTLAQACDSAGDVTPAVIGRWFQTWTALGWFCKPQTRKAHG